MSQAQRFFFISCVAVLLIASLSLSQTLSVPFSQWMPWFALQCVALYAFWVSARDGATFSVARNWFESISLTRVAWACLLLALALDALVLLYGESDNGATRTLLGFHVGPLCVLLVTLFAAMRLSQPVGRRIELLAALALLVVHTFLLVSQPNTWAIVIQMVCLLLIGLVGKGQRRWRMLFLSFSLLIIIAGVLAVFSQPYRVARAAAWLHPETDPLGAGYQLLRIRDVFSTSDFWGHGGSAGPVSLLVLPHDLNINAMPWLSFTWGNAGTALCICLLAALLVMLLRRIVQLETTQRNIALGAWFFLAISNLCSIASPLGLLPLSSGAGIAFLGNGGMGCLVLLLAIFCYSGTPSQPESHADTAISNMRINGALEA
jgi:cell division protein FtsW (lipid II flippase)